MTEKINWKEVIKEQIRVFNNNVKEIRKSKEMRENRINKTPKQSITVKSQ